MKECGACGLVNVDSAERCDCGSSFVPVKAPTLAELMAERGAFYEQLKAQARENMERDDRSREASIDAYRREQAERRKQEDAALNDVAAVATGVGCAGMIGYWIAVGGLIAIGFKMCS